MTYDDPDRQPPGTIERVSWRLERGLAQDTDRAITARFAGGTLAGSIGREPYRAEYTWNARDGALRIAAPGPHSPGDTLERDYLLSLGAVASAQAGPGGGHLVLRDVHGDAVLWFVAVPSLASDLATRWAVQAVQRAGSMVEPISGGSPHLWFDASGQVTGSVGVNRVRGPARTDGESLHLGPLVTTRMTGDPDGMDEEGDLLAALERVARYRVDGDRLTLFDADGTAMVGLTRMSEPPRAVGSDPA